MSESYEVPQSKIHVMPPAAPRVQVRVDDLLYRLAQEATQRIEKRLGMSGIWQNFVEPIAAEKVQEYEGMGPLEFARAIGFLKPHRKRRIA